MCYCGDFLFILFSPKRDTVFFFFFIFLSSSRTLHLLLWNQRPQGTRMDVTRAGKRGPVEGRVLIVVFGTEENGRTGGGEE